MAFENVENFISIAVGLLGFFIMGLMVFSYKSNILVNIYLVYIFFIVSLRMIHNGILGFDITRPLTIDLAYLGPILLTGIPCFFLYFDSLYKDQTQFSPKILVHFIFPLAN